MSHLNTAYKLGAAQAQRDFEKKADAAQQARIRARLEETPQQELQRKWNEYETSFKQTPRAATPPPKPVAPPSAPKPSPIHTAPIGTSHATPTTAPKPPMPQQTPVQMPSAASSGSRSTPAPAPKPVTTPKVTPPPTPKTTATQASTQNNRIQDMRSMSSKMFNNNAFGR